MPEKGVVRSVVEKKKFGFIERPGKDDAFLYFGDYPKGQAPKVGDELEFEVEVAPKGPRAKDIKILKPAPADPSKNGNSTTSPTDSKPLRLQVIVGTLTPAKFHVVTFLTKDESGKPGPGTVIFCLGQRAKVNGAEIPPDDAKKCAVDASGRILTTIQLLDADATIQFTLAETGETVSKSLLKKP